MSIYIIRNKCNDSIYIGSSTRNIKYRYACHISNCKASKKNKLYDEMRKIGINNFFVELLEYIPNITKSELLIKENTYIKQYDSIENGLNTRLPCFNKNAYFKNYYQRHRSKLKRYNLNRYYQRKKRF